MKTTRSKNGLVLQGYFCLERFRGAARPMPNAPRPEPLPAKMRGGAVNLVFAPGLNVVLQRRGDNAVRIGELAEP